MIFCLLEVDREVIHVIDDDDHIHVV